VNSAELEQRLEAAAETQSFEVKAAMAWDEKSLAKDIMALSNVRDGGVIVIGVEDATFTRHGVDGATQATYDVDVMRDQMTKYADPHVDFTVSFPTDADGKTYVAIEVSPFREVPVICRTNSADTRAGAIYYRNMNRRVESAPVSNSYDMRDIITVAATRTRQRLGDLGVSVTSASDAFRQQLDQELDGL
jgi:predicted HTH transcriptional regulator